MFRQFLIFALLLFVTTSTFSQTPPIETGVPQTMAKWRAANYGEVRYKLNITLEKMAPTLKGTIEVSVNLKTASDIVLDWRKIRGKEEFSKISNVVLNDGSVKARETNEHLVICGGKPGANTIKLDFESPILASGAAITRYVDKEDGAEYVYSLFVPSDASTAFPVFDQPDLKARFSLSATFPADWKFVTNTEASTEYKVTVSDCSKNCELRNLDFYETKPISTYVFAFAAGNFEVFRECLYINKAVGKDTLNCLEIPLTYQENRTTSKIYVRKSQAEKFKQHAAEVFQLNREGVKFLESWFDYKFPFPKYDLVLIPEFPFGGMEHAGATFLREDRVIFPTEPTKNDYITRANVIFHEAAHQWFGDTVTMRWFDDLWLKEGFAEFMAYKTLAKVMPEYNAWKIFYERSKQAAYLTDVTRGTTPIYQEIPNLSSAKSAYGNIVYRKAPSFLRQAEFHLGEDKFQTAVRQFLKKHEFANAEWTDLVKEFELASGKDLNNWANVWVKQRGVPIVRIKQNKKSKNSVISYFDLTQNDVLNENGVWLMRLKILDRHIGKDYIFDNLTTSKIQKDVFWFRNFISPQTFVFPNYQDYGYGIFLLDEKSRDYVLENIGGEKDDFLRSMMWGSLWDSVRFYELAPEDYVKLVIKNIAVETDESTIATLLGRVSTAMDYYLPDKQRDEFAPQVENLLTEKMQNAPTIGQRTTFYRAFVSSASTDKSREILKTILKQSIETENFKGINFAPYYTNLLPKLRAKDKFDIVTRLITLGDADGLKLLAELEKTETDDAAKRYAYAARAGIATAENKQKYFADFISNKEISESYIESAFTPFNSIRHADLTLPFLEKALAELPNLKRNRKIFFVNGWLSAFIGGQKSEQALAIVNKFLTDNPDLDKDLRLKILEVADNLERSVKIKKKFAR